MENHRSIPKGYMKVGELAKKAGITANVKQNFFGAVSSFFSSR